MLSMRGNLDLMTAGRQFLRLQKSDVSAGATPRFAELLRDKDVNVVSAYAAASTQSPLFALASEGDTTVVMVNGALRFYVKKHLARYWDWTGCWSSVDFSPNAVVFVLYYYFCYFNFLFFIEFRNEF